MDDLDIPARLADHNRYCIAKRRLFAPLAALCWMVSYGIAALAAVLLGLTDAAFWVVVWLTLSALAVDGWWQLRAYAARDAYRIGLAAGTVAATPEVSRARRGWMRRGLLPAEGPDPLRRLLRVLCAAPRLSASAWHAPEDALPWTHGELARATGLVQVVGARGEDWQPVLMARDDGHLVPGLEVLGVLEVRAGETEGEMRVPPLLWRRYFAKPPPHLEVFVVPSGE